MASDTPPPQKPPQELAAVDDADFGRMRLISQPYHAMTSEDEGWQEDAMLSWEGELSGVVFKIHVDEADDFPDVPAASRALFLKLASEESDIRRHIATVKLELAKDWAASVDLPEPSAQSFFAAIRLETIDTYDDWRPTLWFGEIEQDNDRSIFGGHVLEVRFSADGEIEEIGLAG